MPRPQRIEYEGAFHHVMNRGRGRMTIFHDDAYYEVFLETLQEASKRFDAVIHAYCLMKNHYHLLIETPRANLSRIMRHVNGVYTQRYNRLRGTDGPLFRGRFKSILVDEDTYLLRFSRYIHRNPIETKKPVVNTLADYPWSSYPAYVNKSKCPDWLQREKTFQMLGQKRKYQGYQEYVAQGVDEVTLSFYSRGNILPVLGDLAFREMARQESEETDLDKLRAALQDRPTSSEIVARVAKIFGTKADSITKKSKGPRTPNSARAFAMYVCQEYGDLSLKDIMQVFELRHTGSASFSINKIRQEIGHGMWKKEVKALERYLYIVK
ncbi:MAG: transposase [Arenicellales bacterium]